eukprot:3133358-Lingulodinium_polyedra.AAC.1
MEVVPARPGRSGRGLSILRLHPGFLYAQEIRPGLEDAFPRRTPTGDVGTHQSEGPRVAGLPNPQHPGSA